MVIKADLPDRQNARMTRKLSDFGKHGVRKLPGVFRVQPDGRVDPGILFREPDRRTRRSGIAAHVHDMRYAASGQRFQKRCPVGVKCGIVVMGVGIEKSHLTLEPEATPSIKTTRTSFSPASAARIMPWLSTPHSVAGLRLATMMTS